MAESLSRRMSLILDLGTSGGEWMFKQSEMVFGPLPARQMIEKLNAGEIAGNTLIASSSEEGAFVPLREVPFFAVHLAKAEAKLRVKRDSDAFHTREARGFRTRTAVIAVLVVGALGGAGGVAYYLAAQRHLKLQREIDDIPIIANPPELSGADALASEEDVAIPLPGAPPSAMRRARRPVAGSGAGAGQGAHPTTDGLAAINYDKNSIIGAEVRQKAQLIPCIKQELQRVPTFRGDIRFTVAVGNDGKVAKLWMDDPQQKEGPLQACFTQRMNGWRFTAYDGERATISDSFRVGR